MDIYLFQPKFPEMRCAGVEEEPVLMEEGWGLTLYKDEHCISLHAMRGGGGGWGGRKEGGAGMEEETLYAQQ